jgi:hypothetical protein
MLYVKPRFGGCLPPTQTYQMGLWLAAKRPSRTSITCEGGAESVRSFRQPCDGPGRVQ